MLRAFHCTYISLAFPLRAYIPRIPDSTLLLIIAAVPQQLRVAGDTYSIIHININIHIQIDINISSAVRGRHYVRRFFPLR